MTQKQIKQRAIEILAKHGCECTVKEMEHLIDDDNAVLKLRYCLDAIIVAIKSNPMLPDLPTN